MAVAPASGVVGVHFSRSLTEKSDHRYGWLLRARRERPRGRHAEKRDERAPNRGKWKMAFAHS